MARRFFVFLFLPLAVFALEKPPWLGEVYQFHFTSSYAYSHFNSVADSLPPYHRPFHSNLFSFELDFTPTSEWGVDLDLQFAETSQQAFNFRSTAVQVRYAWLDDIIGDPVALITGGNIRFTPTDSLHDISCPSHANVDFTLNLALGKEFEASETWMFRMWGFGAVGQANRGSPWVQALAALEAKIGEQHLWTLYGEGISGYGRHAKIDVDHFDGYAKVRNKSIDVALRYGYRMGVWGVLRFEYIRRVLAKACPEQVNTGVVSWRVPFSF